MSASAPISLCQVGAVAVRQVGPHDRGQKATQATSDEGVIDGLRDVDAQPGQNTALGLFPGGFGQDEGSVQIEDRRAVVG